VVDNYERMFRALHRQFRWPLPGLPAAQPSRNFVATVDIFLCAPPLSFTVDLDVPDRGDGGQVSAVGAASITSYGRDFRQDEKARELAYVAQKRYLVIPVWTLRLLQPLAVIAAYRAGCCSGRASTLKRTIGSC